MEIKERIESRDSHEEVLDGKEVTMINGVLSHCKRSCTRRFIITKATENQQSEVRQLVYQTAGGYFDGCRFKSSEIKYRGGDIYDAEVNYESRIVESLEESSEADNIHLFTLASFDTTGKTEERFVSDGTVKAPNNKAPDFHNCINVDEEGNVRGCTVVSPKMSIRMRTTVAKVTWADTIRWADMTGCVNSNAFNNCAAGTLLYLGGSGDENEDGTWTVTHSFEYAKKRTVKFRPPGANADVRLECNGHDFVWFRYKAVEERTGNDDDAETFTIYKPQFGYAESVYPAVNFTF